VLYAAARAARVYCLEPDPVAYAGLLRNLRINPQYRNVETLDQCLSDREGTIQFGGNGALGNSESSMLAAQAGYAQRCADQPRKANADKERRWRAARTVPVRTVTIECLYERWRLEDCTLVKMDIEGGESVVIPAIANFLQHNRPALCLSLHWVYLQRAEIQRVLDVLTDIYSELVLPDLSTVVTANDVLERRISDIVCVGAAR
jgi:FkbM family methyltransferase